MRIWQEDAQSFSFDEKGELIPSDSGERRIHARINMTRSLEAGTTTPDLPPTEENGVTMRDYEYKRFGALALLAAIDLATGKAHPAA